MDAAKAGLDGFGSGVVRTDRWDARAEGLSIRALAVRHGVHRRKVRHALDSSALPEHELRQGVSWRLELFKGAIDTMRQGAPYGLRSFVWACSVARS